MGVACELVTVQATAPGATAVAFSAVTGNSLTIRETKDPAWLAAVWQSRQAAGFLRMTSPLLHDAVVGIQMQAPIGQTVTLCAAGVQRLYGQDTLTVVGTGSATAGDIEQGSFIVAYENLPGVSGKFIDRAELWRRSIDIYGFPNTLSTGTSGGYSGEETLIAEADQLYAQTEYAIVGYDLTVACGAVRYRSVDWGSLGVGGPGPVGGTSGALETRDWFLRLSDEVGMPLIPVFHSGNKALILLDAAQDENGGDPVITTYAVRLAPQGPAGKRASKK